MLIQSDSQVPGRDANVYGQNGLGRAVCMVWSDGQDTDKQGNSRHTKHLVGRIYGLYLQDTGLMDSSGKINDLGKQYVGSQAPAYDGATQLRFPTVLFVLSTIAVGLIVLS